MQGSLRLVLSVLLSLRALPESLSLVLEHVSFSLCRPWSCLCDTQRELPGGRSAFLSSFQLARVHAALGRRVLYVHFLCVLLSVHRVADGVPLQSWLTRRAGQTSAAPGTAFSLLSRRERERMGVSQRDEVTDLLTSFGLRYFFSSRDDRFSGVSDFDGTEDEGHRHRGGAD